MNDLVNNAPTMSSIELVEVINSMREEGRAELTHSDFLKKVEKVLGKDAGKFSSIYRDSMNREKPCYRFPKREASLMVMSESYEVQAKVYDRMAELEAKTPAIDPMQMLSDPAAMRGLLLTYTEKVLELEDSVKALEPKAQAFDRIATGSEGSFCIRDAAKTLNMQEKRLRQFLVEHGWIYHRPMGSGWLAYADKIQFGFMEHKITRGEKSDGSEWVNTQARITAKGMARLSKILAEEGAPA